MTQIIFGAPQRQMAANARRAARGADALYHGTRYPMRILRTNALACAEFGDPCVSFSRSPEIAAYWALQHRDDGEPQGGILIVECQLLRRRFRIEPFNDPSGWNEDEMEERLWWRTILGLSRYLVGVVAEADPDFLGQRGSPLESENDWTIQGLAALRMHERRILQKMKHVAR